MISGKLSVVLPAHNECDNLPAVVARAEEVLPELVCDYELVIVDDGSRDGTTELADGLARRNRRIQVVHHPVNRGYGAALTSGFAAARGDYIMFMDADRQFDIADLSLLGPFVGKYDIVAGYRIDRQDARHRILYAHLFKVAMRLLFGIRLRDIDCAFKVFRADLLKEARLESPGALINTEILAKARRAGASWVEIGVHHYPRPAGESSGGSARVIARAMRETLRLWRRMLRYQPPDRKAGTAAGDLPLLAVASGLLAGLVIGLTSLIVRRRRS